VSKLPGINPGVNKYALEAEKEEKPFVEKVVFGLTWVRPPRSAPTPVGNRSAMSNGADS
jgi:hypothetical protein|tara:strand:+ start:741 stop:917 length:177 start_codon:yes stop_codon:yes gene_type:complete